VGGDQLLFPPPPPGQNLVKRKTFLLEAQSIDLSNSAVEQVGMVPVYGRLDE
jgi:hypothetical protein